MEKITKWLIILVLAAYVASPVDLAPGPIDDAIAILIYLVAARRKRAINVFDDGYDDEYDDGYEDENYI
ncbi:MAG: hypothetical protein K6F73_05725 [Lachnospiraceae bacterium]|nr:hypothetical protein [Lachnospiraceae bacterium]